MTEGQVKAIKMAWWALPASIIAASIVWAGVWSAWGAFTDYVAEKELERRQVAIDWTASDWSLRDGVLSWTAYGTKQRDCKPYRDDQWSAFVLSEGLRYEFHLFFPEDKNPGSSAPTGRNSFGRFAVRVHDLPLDGEVRANVPFSCPGEEDPVYSLVGPFHFDPESL